MDRRSYSVADLLERGAMDQPRELRQLFHQLNNQLGIILAHAELLEKKAADETSRSRATQVVSSVLDAMGTAKQIRMQMGKRASKPDQLPASCAAQNCNDTPVIETAIILTRCGRYRQNFGCSSAVRTPTSRFVLASYQPLK